MKTMKRIIIVSFVFLLSGVLFAQDTGQRRIDLDILNMNVEAVLKIISDTSGWSIVPSPKVRGKISLWSKGATARELLDKLVLVNDYVYQQEGNVIFLMTRGEYEQSFGTISRTFSLEHQRADNIQELLKNSLTKTGKLSIDPWSNTIVVNDTKENLGKIETLIKKLDTGFIQKRFQLVNAKASDVAKTLDALCPKEGPFQAQARTNSIVVFNSQANVERIAKLIAELDKDVITRVFQIKFQKASELAKQLSILFSQSGEGKTSENVKQIIVSDSTNQIIVSSSESQVDYICELIQELDSKVITATIGLKNLKAAEVLPQVVSLASKAENIKADSQGNQLIIHDNTNNIEQIREVIGKLDSDIVTRVFTLEHALAKDIENILRTLVTNPNTFKADSRTNQILICDSKSQVARIEKIISKLDCEDAYFTRVYSLTHVSASYAADIIESFIGKARVSQSSYNGKIAKKEITNDQTLQSKPTNVVPGSAPGLAGTSSKKQAVMQSSHLSTTPPPASASPPVDSEAGEAESKSLGLAGTVVADDRSNTITVTETLATLSKIEQLIKELDVPIKSYLYTVKYRRMDSLDLDNRLADLLRANEDKYSIDNQTHTVHFTTIPSVAEKVLARLEQWDKPAKQALIRAKIIAVNSSKLKDIGINFESLFDIANAEMILKGSFPSQVGDDHAGSITVRKLTGTQYEAIIRAIESNNNSQILASPHILTLDGQPAELRMASDEPFKETSIDADNGRVIENVRFLQVGTMLIVKPNIKEDDTIEMDISLDVSSLIEIRNGIPVVNHNIASSTVAIKNNHVLMIGGLKFKRDIEVKETVPILGDIPIVGNLFSSSRKELTDSELVLLLQPSIVNESEEQKNVELKM